MSSRRRFISSLLGAALLLNAASAGAADVKRGRAKGSAEKRGASRGLAPQVAVEAKAMEILQSSCARLAAAKAISFTAVVSYENPSRLGVPLVYTTRSDVLMQRPDKLRVLTPADGPPSEFYYDGKTMVAFAPSENLVAVADAPPTIDAALKAAFDSAAIYFPFSDLIVADPCEDLSEGLKMAFSIGQSQVVGGIITDMVAYANDGVFVQMWIGADDKLPRRVRAVYSADRQRLRNEMELSNWQLDPNVPPDAFSSVKAGAATQIRFAHPEAKPPSAEAPPPGKRPKKH